MVREPSEFEMVDAISSSGLSESPATHSPADPTDAQQQIAEKETEEEEEADEQQEEEDEEAKLLQPAPVPSSSPAEPPAPSDVAELQAALGKLSSGFKSALGQLTAGDATSQLTKLAGGLTAGLSSGLSGWFSAADTSNSAKKPSPVSLTSKMAFQGSLYVTEKHVCFSVEERRRQLPLKIPLQDITAASRQLPAQKGGSDLLRLELAPGSTGAAGGGPLPRHLAFKDFSAEPGSLGGPAGPSSGLSSGGALDSALALIEHLTEAEEEG
ncbi:hypothetical protein QJQ45_013235 [Haematococcus lacustris]|nr:hypothetical protein QJQ45_013235 [Haematococcus lacustris]